ncbi:MAG: ATP-binding protein [Lachnobacterium sp.]|nr:ATP-binding protein [Lachnobacterium sp.]
MMLFFLGVCMCITFFVLQTYITTGFHAREHRLLPLVLALVALYNFYRIVQAIMGHSRVFEALIDLLVIQMVYALFHYVMDFMHFKIKAWVEALLFFSLLLSDFMMFYDMVHDNVYQNTFLVSLLGYVLLTLGFSTYARILTPLSQIEGHVNDMLYASIALPGFALLFRVFSRSAEDIVMPIALECTCLIIYYLMMTGQLANVTIAMQEDYYNTSDIACFLFDSKMHFRDANLEAKKLFAESVQAMEEEPDNYRYYSSMLRWSTHPEDEFEKQYGDLYYKCQLQPVFKDDYLRGYILCVIDITHLKQETKLMEQLKREAENQSVLKGKFLASVSHDLRSPLHAIIGGSEILLRRKNLSSESRTMLGYIRNAGNNLLEQVNTILVYSKLEAGKLILHKKEYNFYNLLKEQAHICLMNLNEKPVEFVIRVENEFPEMLIGDESCVRQVIQNLLSNATKFTDRGSVICTIRCSMEQESSIVHVHGSVEDTGIGMSAEQLEQIFGEYVSYSNDRGLEGSGLGLSLVKQMVDLMHGSICASSTEGVGTRIMFDMEQEKTSSVMLPPTNIDRELLLKKPIYAINDVKPNWVFPGARVLLVDDMEVNRLIFKKLVTPWKLTVDLAASGEEAIQAARLHEYQMIILDQMMPQKSGIETADEISKFCDVPLVLMTADISDATRAEALLHGFIEFLPKPVQLENLRTLLEGCLPVEYREMPPTDAAADLQGKDREEALAYVRTLETYCREVQELISRLDEYERTNLDMFRVKVHGIKGISRQIGQDDMGEQAEIMEMAAKTENHVFIRRNLPKFLTQLQSVHDAVEQEYQELERQYADKNKEKTGRESISPDARIQLWKNLKEAFDGYDLNKIEQFVKKLDETVLTPEESTKLGIAKDACDNLEYEDGSAACEEVIGILTQEA